MDLAWRGIEQIGTAHDLADALRGVVDDHGKLIGEPALDAPDHEIADGAAQILMLRAVQGIGEGDVGVGHTQTPRRRPRRIGWRGARGGMATGPRFEIAPAAPARIDVTGAMQALERLAIGALAPALVE